MAPIFVFFLILAVSNAFPDQGAVVEQDIVLDMVAREFVSYPDTYSDVQRAEMFNIADHIKGMVDDVLANIPDPIKVEDQNVNFNFENDISGAVSSRGVYVTGQSTIVTDTLRINLLVPTRTRVTYKISVPILVIHIDSININIAIGGININCYIKGKVYILDSDVQGLATINAVTQKLTGLTTNIRFGTIHSNLVGILNEVNTTSILTTIFTDIIPEMLTLFNHQINEIVATSILELF